MSVDCHLLYMRSCFCVFLCFSLFYFLFCLSCLCFVLLLGVLFLTEKIRFIVITFNFAHLLALYCCTYMLSPSTKSPQYFSVEQMQKRDFFVKNIKLCKCLTRRNAIKMNDGENANIQWMEKVVERSQQRKRIPNTLVIWTTRKLNSGRNDRLHIGCGP